MDDSGAIAVDRPRQAAGARRIHPAGCSQPPSEAELIRRLLTPSQRLSCSLIPGTVHGWVRSLGRRRRAASDLWLLAGLVDPHRTAVDVGANKGADAWLLSRLCRHVYAYEPNPAMRRMLTCSTPPNVTVFPRALSNRPGEATLYVPRRRGRPLNTIGTLQPLPDMTDCEQIPVTTTRLDDDALADVGFLKIDVAGHEQEVIQGASELIIRNRPVIQVGISVSEAQRPAEATIEFVERLGYRAHMINGSRLQPWSPQLETPIQLPGETQTLTRNYVFLPAAHSMARAA